MLAKVKTSKHSSSISKDSRPSAGSSGAFEQGLTPASEISPEPNSGSATPEVQAAQKLLSQIAVRILNTNRKEEKK